MKSYKEGYYEKAHTKPEPENSVCEDCKPQNQSPSVCSEDTPSGNPKIVFTPEGSFNLTKYRERDATGWVYPEEKLQEAVRRFKEKCKIDWDKGNFVLYNVNENIDKIFGEKLR